MIGFRLQCIMLVSFRVFSEAEALSIIRTFHWNFPKKEKNLFGEDDNKNNRKKFEEKSKSEQISKSRNVAAVMQLSRDRREVSAFRFQDSRLKKAAMLLYHLFIYTFISHLKTVLKCEK